MTYVPAGGSKRNPKIAHFHGTGNYHECAQRCRDLLQYEGSICRTAPPPTSSAAHHSVCSCVRCINSKETECWTNVCSFSGVYLPRYGNHTFYAFSAFGRLFESLDLPLNMTLNELSALSTRLCSTRFDLLMMQYSQIDPTYLRNYCFLSTWMYIILADGYGLNRNTTQVVFKTAIEGKEFTWTLGSVIYEANNYPLGTWDIDRPPTDWAQDWSHTLAWLCVLLIVGWILTVWYQHRYWSQRVRTDGIYQSLKS